MKRRLHKTSPDLLPLLGERAGVRQTAIFANHKKISFALRYGSLVIRDHSRS